MADALMYYFPERGCLSMKIHLFFSNVSGSRYTIIRLPFPTWSIFFQYMLIEAKRGQRQQTNETSLLTTLCIFFSTGHVPRFELGRDYCCELRLFGRPTFWGNVFFSRPRVFADLSARDNGKTNGWNVWYYNFVTSAEGRDNNGHVARPSRNITRSLRSD